MTTLTKKRGKDEMVIEHITYDETHQPMRPQTSASEEMGTLISSQRSRSSNEQVSSRSSKIQTARPVTLWPRANMQTQPAEQVPDIASYIDQKHREEKAARKQEKIMSKAYSSGRYLLLSGELNAGETKGTSTLRRKEKFSEIVMAKLNRLSNQNEKRPLMSRDENMAIFEDLRKAIREGQMERVVPPKTEERERLTPTYRLTSSRSAPAGDSNTTGRATKSRNSKAHRKNKSSLSKLAAYVEKGKETRTQCKFKSPFEHLNYPSFSLSKKVLVGSSTSSFYCIGEDVQEHRSKNEAIKALKNRQSENRRRLSDEGSSPWRIPALEKCRLCGKAGVQGVRGLCSECEGDFLRPKTGAGFGISYQDPEDEEEVKPTPPLKDRNTLSMRKSSDRSYLLRVPRDASDDEKPAVLKKDNVRLATANAESKPTVEVVSSRIFSQHAEIGEEEESDPETIKRWEASPFVTLPDKSRNLFEKWSACYRSGDYRQLQTEDEDMTPLIPSAVKSKLSRDTSFYDFWDEVLDDSGSERSRNYICSRN